MNKQDIQTVLDALHIVDSCVGLKNYFHDKPDGTERRLDRVVDDAIAILKSELTKLNSHLDAVIADCEKDALAEPSEPVAWTESAIDEYLSGYSLIGDDGDYTPTDDEKFVIKDAIIGFMSATPDCWDTAAYPALEDAIIEAKAWEHCTNEDCAHPATSKPAPLPELTREELLGAIARGWCTERNAYKTMDVELAEDIAEAVWEKLE